VGPALVLKVVSRLYVLKRRMGKGKTYATYFLYLPSKLVSDSTFPLKENRKVSIRIKGNSIIAEDISRKRRRRK